MLVTGTALEEHMSGLPSLVSVAPAEAAPSESAIRRALRRVRDGAVLDVIEAAVLLAARGEQLDALLAAASTVRDAGLVDAGR
ncbi:hypothetical protein ACL02T_06510, partial [Pseudonocardia sp. RS010]|uniref:hypothetical protein n=1 Tax=Pseudonocardia sp. RS010 TaxID=3385979 RepID=UPI0039A0B4FE